MKLRSKPQGLDPKLEGVRLKTNFIKYYFTRRIVDAWNRLPDEEVRQSSVSGFKHA